jgi:hypothetical protein
MEKIKIDDKLKQDDYEISLYGFTLEDFANDSK